MSEIPYGIIATVIDKNKLRLKYPEPYNPYEIALLFCMERLHSYLISKGQENKKVFLVFESRGKKEDDELELEFRRICDNNSNWGYRNPDFKRFDFKLIFSKKSSNSTGLQLADLMARPIALNYIRPSQENRAYEILCPKKVATTKIFP
jgi:hypothetical protein